MFQRPQRHTDGVSACLLLSLDKRRHIDLDPLRRMTRVKNPRTSRRDGAPRGPADVTAA
jgi:hypothetical protein